MHNRTVTAQIRTFARDKNFAHSAIRVHDRSLFNVADIASAPPEPNFDVAAELAVELLTGSEEEYVAATIGAFCQLWLKRIRGEDKVEEG